ncbi:TetR/AcrR family transcriptional regulator [Chitinimonas lacunae]|uniref:TetR/AcrR family transcriptional regulator n=1 Tax=Chitinimonas lacunae TaxID=1963018 RepID=A0ABV8MUH9_9NEIS
MGIADRKRRDREALRQKVLDAARELYAEGGYDALTVRAIANRIEYSTTVIYSLFEDKDALLRALSDADFAVLTERLVAGDRPDAPPAQRILLLARNFTRFAVEHPEQYKLIFVNPVPPYSPEEAAAERGNPSQDAYAFARLAFRSLAETTPTLVEKDPDVLVQLFWGALHGLISLHVVMGDEPWVEWKPLDQLVSAAMHALLRGLGIKESALETPLAVAA